MSEGVRHGPDPSVRFRTRQIQAARAANAVWPCALVIASRLRTEVLLAMFA